MKLLKTPVLIAGGGPIGLTLAHVLSKYGIHCTLVERNKDTTRHPKMDLTNARSMEIFQRIGVAGVLRAAGVPEDHDMTVVYASSLRDTAHELHRFTYPSVTRKRWIIREVNDGTQPAEPPMRISQAVLEPTLKQALEGISGATVRYGCALESCEEAGDRVIASIRDADSGEIEKVECAYLVGCDGANSIVRKCLGIAVSGQTGLRASYLVHFRSKALEVLQRWGVNWHRRSGGVSMVAQDDKEMWTLHCRLAPDGSDVPADPAALLEKLFGCDIDAEIIVANEWRANLLVADQYRKGRILLAGDAVHQVVPTGGYGMNSGVGDAMDVGWKLTAVLQGWGGERLLESYEAERRPVALTNREASKRHLTTREGIRELFAKAGDLDEDSTAGEARRQELAGRLRAIGNAENESFGVEYGYRYGDSPIVVQENEEPPAFDPIIYRPSTWPGSRLPSTVLPDGTLLYERLGPWFTLVIFGRVDVGAFEEVTRRCGMPATVLRLADVEPGTVYERHLLLVRPDHHVAWRGDQPPADWHSVVAKACGQLLPAE